MQVGCLKAVLSQANQVYNKIYYQLVVNSTKKHYSKPVRKKPWLLIPKLSQSVRCDVFQFRYYQKIFNFPSLMGASESYDTKNMKIIIIKICNSVCIYTTQKTNQGKYLHVEQDSYKVGSRSSNWDVFQYIFMSSCGLYSSWTCVTY